MTSMDGLEKEKRKRGRGAGEGGDGPKREKKSARDSGGGCAGATVHASSEGKAAAGNAEGEQPRDLRLFCYNFLI